MSKIEYNIIWQSSEKISLKKVKGKAIVISGIKCAIRKYDNNETFWGSFDDYEVTNLETGMLLGYGMSQKEAIEMCEKRIALPIYNDRVNEAKNMLKVKGIKLPVNI